MVCTHGNVDVACARFGFPIYEQLRQTQGGKWMSGRVDEWESNGNTHPPIHPSTHPPIYPSTRPPLPPSASGDAATLVATSSPLP